MSDTSNMLPGIPHRSGDGDARANGAGDPVAWLVEDLMKLMTVPVFATSVRKHVDGIYSDPAEYRVTPLYARNAAAASNSTALVDALRVAERALEDMCEDDVREGETISWFEARALRALPTIRDALAGHPAPTNAPQAMTRNQADRDSIESAVQDALARVDAMAPEEREAMWRKQRESWGRAEMSMGESSVVTLRQPVPAAPFDALQDEAWQSMDTAPTDGTNVLLAIKFGPFVYKVQGMYHDRKWHNAADRDGEILCWMKTPMIPDHFLPWTEDYAARHAPAPALKDETPT